MTQEKFKQRAEAAVNRIKSAQIDADLQDSLVELVEDARIATNGLTQEEKIQAMSENQFAMAVLLVQNCIACMQERKNEETSTSWKDLLYKCKKEIMYGFISVIALIAFRPSIADAITHIINVTSK